VTFDLFPAIDLRGGQCVRLYQGDFDAETVYSDDPVGQALTFAGEGAPWIHVVDLDGARTGEPTNRDVITAIAGAVEVPVQVGGGVRSRAAADALFEAGVDRVVIGTAALEQPQLVREIVTSGGRVAVGLDGRRGEVAIRGWVQSSGRRVAEVANDFADAGVEAVIVTEIERDGTLAGPDVDGLRALLAQTEIPVVASGGVGSLADLVALADLDVSGRRLAGVIAGRAIYDGAFTVGQGVHALRVLRGGSAGS
jgi:phosphoribosylformimino-5-aminoimidazole carboxamide ribotide isomerase